MITRKYTIVCRGETEDALTDALEEALRRVQLGMTSGGDQRDDAGFYFNVTDDVLPNEVPA